MKNGITLGIEEEFIVSDLQGNPTQFNIEELNKNIESKIFSFSQETRLILAGKDSAGALRLPRSWIAILLSGQDLQNLDFI